ncbi:MAG: recombinase family protein [Actinomycetaceae bacterium]|nr:recombinase family protein [Actinomycetaceae bacterium]
MSTPNAPVAYNDNSMVVAYYRYSSASQNEASIEQQRDMVTRWAKEQGLHIVKEYADAAMSGRSADRPEYQLMLRELETIRPAYVAVWKNDRLARDRAELLFAKQAIRNAGARLHFIEGISPTDSADSVLIEGITDAFAEYYSLQLASNIRRGINYNAERALSNGRKIFGFSVDENKRYIPDPTTAPFVKQMFTDYASGVPMATIAERLNAQGVRTSTGARFTVKALNKLLKNRAYIGEYSYAGHIVEDGMPRLVDDYTFKEVQRRFALNKRRIKPETTDTDTDTHYWLTGKLYCRVCGSTMSGTSGTSKTGKTHRYYTCHNTSKKTCSAPKARKKT